MNVLVTGGLGFIGSHIVVELLQANNNVIIVDNLSNTQLSVLDDINQITNKHPILYNTDMTNFTSMEKIFVHSKIDCVIHLAGLKSVSESVSHPLDYYHNNLLATLNLLNLMVKYNVNNIIFSSSATVYGTNKIPLRESDQIGRGITNPYGKTKYMLEEILVDVQKAHPDLTVIILRYFNPIGAHPSGKLIENPNGKPNNLMPFILKVAAGTYTELCVYGSDYDTSDGTCVRDFIHVVDLAKGHISCMKLMNYKGTHVYNLGKGTGSSVKEIIETFQKVNDIQLNVRYTERRTGDLPIIYADVTKINNELGWIATHTLEDMCRDSWNAYANKNLLNINKKN